MVREVIDSLFLLVIVAGTVQVVVSLLDDHDIHQTGVYRPKY